MTTIVGRSLGKSKSVPVVLSATCGLRTGCRLAMQAPTLRDLERNVKTYTPLHSKRSRSFKGY